MSKIEDYIKENLKKGYSKKKIIDSLHSAGYHKKQIEEGFKNLNKIKKKKLNKKFHKPHHAYPLAFIIAIIIVTVISLIYLKVEKYEIDPDSLRSLGAQNKISLLKTDKLFPAKLLVCEAVVYEDFEVCDRSKSKEVCLEGLKKYYNYQGECEGNIIDKIVCESVLSKNCTYSNIGFYEDLALLKMNKKEACKYIKNEYMKELCGKKINFN